MMSLSLVLFSAALAAILWYFFRDQKAKKYPPGPWRIPLIGNILAIGQRPHLTFSSWVKDYGNIMMVHMMNIKMVVISDQKLAREALNNLVLVGAPNLEVFKILSGGDYGILSTSGQKWIEIRRFVIRHLRDYGFGKNTMETNVMQEVTEFIDLLKLNEGKPQDVKRYLQLAVVNSLWSIMGGQRFKLDDKRLNDMLAASNKALTEATESPIGIFFPSLAKAFPNISGWNNFESSVKDVHEFLDKFVIKHSEQYDANDTPTDFTESFLHEMHTTTDPSSIFYGETGEKNLRSIIMSLFLAGSGTTSDVLTFAILYLTKWVEIQKQLQEEIERVVGKSRHVCLEDRKNMPYTQAVISETLRFSTLTPLGLFHAALEDVTFGSFTIPKGAWLAVNQHHIHRSESIWGPDVNSFNPARFLSPDGQTVLRNDALIPFSVGKRACVGESLARDEIFLFLTNTFQKFHIEFDPNAPKPSVESATNAFNTPHKFDVIVKDRITSTN